MENKNTCIKNNSHSRFCRLQDSGIYNACSCKNPVMKNSFQHLHLTQTRDKKEEILNQVQDDNYFKDKALNEHAFRAPLRSGFTLIELLVVVLIIGILAAVALPQYQKAVDRAKATEVWTLGKAFSDAQKIHFMANESFATSLENLDIAIPAETKNWQITLVNTAALSHLDFSGKGNLSGFSISYWIYPARPPFAPLR